MYRHCDVAAVCTAGIVCTRTRIKVDGRRDNSSNSSAVYAREQWPRMGFARPGDGINYLSRPLLYRWRIREGTGGTGGIPNLTEPQKVFVFGSIYADLLF